MGVMVSASTVLQVQNALRQLSGQRLSGYVSCANAYSVGLAEKDPEFLEILNAAKIVTADGVPVVWALRLFGQDNERVHNDDLMLSTCERFPDWRHFLVGGRDGQPEQVAKVLRERFPGIAIAGCRSTPLRPVPVDDTDSIVHQIEDSRPDVVWAALGTPQQDYWMHSVAHRLNVPLVGCGSLFDLLSGRTRATPDWMKRAGLQWLYRLIQEPKRLAYRYGYYNTRFIVGVTRQYLRINTTKQKVI